MQHARLGRRRGQVGGRVEHPQGHALQREGVLPSERAIIAKGCRLRPAGAHQNTTQRNCRLQAVTHVFSPLLGKRFSGDHPSRSSSGPAFSTRGDGPAVYNGSLPSPTGPINPRGSTRGPPASWSTLLRGPYPSL